MQKEGPVLGKKIKTKKEGREGGGDNLHNSASGPLRRNA